MNPPVPAVLAELAGLAIKNAMPGVPDAERASDLGLSAALLGLAAEVWDRQAHILVEENRAVRVLLGEAGEDADLRLLVLKAENDRLRAALIEAHAAAEAAGDTARQQAIWAELVAATDRRRLSTAPV
jgi:predicted regulator of Ras-like GTPase activity (Roadblock/LC7/MglB family)